MMSGKKQFEKSMMLYKEWNLKASGPSIWNQIDWLQVGLQENV